MTQSSKGCFRQVSHCENSMLPFFIKKKKTQTKKTPLHSCYCMVSRSAAVLLLVMPGKRAQAEPSEFPAVTICVICELWVGSEVRVRFASSHEEALHGRYSLPVPLLNTYSVYVCACMRNFACAQAQWKHIAICMRFIFINSSYKRA